MPIITDDPWTAQSVKRTPKKNCALAVLPAPTPITLAKNSLTKAIQPKCRPSKELIDHWKIVVTLKLVENWLELASGVPKTELEYFSQQMTCQNDEIREFIVDTIKSKIKVKKIENCTVGKLDPERLLNEKFSETCRDLNLLLQARRIENSEAIRKLICCDWKKNTPRKLLTSAQDLITNLVEEQKRLELANKESVQNQSAALEQYNQLIKTLPNLRINSSQYTETSREIWKNITDYYVYKVEAAYYYQQIKTLVNLIQLAKTYSESAQQTIGLLTQLQNSLKSQPGKDEVISLPIHLYLTKSTMLGELNKLENSIGHTIFYWHSSVTWQQVKAKILFSVEPICFEIFYKYLQQLFEK